MKTFIMFVVLPVAAIMIFMSGSLPYTSIYDEQSLKKLRYAGKEPVSAEVVESEVLNADDLSLGSVMETSFRATLTNHTNRFVVISAIGEIFSPNGRSSGMHSQLMILNPNATERTSFRSNTPYTDRGHYRCEMRSTIGRFDY